MSPRALRNPLFTASTTPLSGSDTQRNSGMSPKDFSTSTVWSVEAPSMTTISMGR
jgi:hypothetical protein